MKFYKFYLVVLLLLFVSACGPSEDSRSLYQKTNRYPQDFTSPVALFIRERNGTPFILASAFLIDRQRGLFGSAKHFVGNESDGQCKIFFNGQVYNGFLVTVPEVTDVAVIKIEGSFDYQTFPEPYPLAVEVHQGEKVFIQGIHPHPTQFQANKKIIPIFGRYYEIIGKNDEFVFDDLEAEIVEVNRKIANNTIKDSSEILAGVSGSYTLLQAKEDHQFSFAGLSGGPTVNERHELVGINAIETQAYIEVNQQGAVYHPWVTLNLVSAEEIRKLLPKLAVLK